MRTLGVDASVRKLVLVFPAAAAVFGYAHGMAWRMICRGLDQSTELPECTVTQLWSDTPVTAVLYYASALVPLAVLYNLIWKPRISAERQQALRREFLYYGAPALTLMGVIFTALVAGENIWRRGSVADFAHLVLTSMVAGLLLLYVFWAVALRMSAIAADLPSALDRAAARLFAHTPLTIGLFLAFFASFYGDQAIGPTTTVGAMVVVTTDLLVMGFIAIVQVGMSVVLLPDDADAA
jgi:hypothetical protein